ncbi:MAG: hypothetical protein GY821_05530, partial [Gammaproteobacteria bacterium]|nr:hypothetical protein [Gammaproteobacteria bacterium]
NYNQNQYPRGNFQGGRPAPNQTGVRTAVPYVEYPAESYDGEEGSFPYYDSNQPDPHSAIFLFYPQIEGGYTPEEQYGPVTQDPALATGLQQVREQLSLNQTNITEQIANQSASAQKEREEYTQRLSKLEDNLKAHISRISAKDIPKVNQSPIVSPESDKPSTSMNIFTAAPHLLTEVYTPWVPEDEVMPLQCVAVPTLKVNVEGKIFKCIIDTGAGPSLVVSENLGREILFRKHKTRDEVDRAIKKTDTSTSISDCQGKEVKIIGQAIVRLKQGSVLCNTPMLLLKGDQKNMEPLIG